MAFANEPDSVEASNLNYGGNYVSTTKYTLATFVPKALFEQLRRVANMYFLFTGCLSFIRLAPYSGGSAILPLVGVIGATMAKEAIEDWRRYQQVGSCNPSLSDIIMCIVMIDFMQLSLVWEHISEKPFPIAYFILILCPYACDMDPNSSCSLRL